MENKIEIGTKCIIAYYDFLENKNEMFFWENEIIKVTPKRLYTKSKQIFDKETLQEIKAKDDFYGFTKTQRIYLEMPVKRMEIIKKRNFITDFISSYKIDFNKLSDSEIDSLFSILEKGCKKS